MDAASSTVGLILPLKTKPAALGLGFVYTKKPPSTVMTCPVI